MALGCRFDLDLMVNAGSHPNANGQESYLTFTYSILQNARADQIANSCTLTNTITPDFTTFDSLVQNEVCNGPGACTFRGITVGPGSLAAATIAFNNPPAGGIFRVAAIGLCTIAPGQAITRMEALRCATQNGAYLTFDEDKKGSLEPGKLADLAVLSADPLTVPEPAIRDITADLTMVGGKIVHQVTNR